MSGRTGTVKLTDKAVRALASRDKPYKASDGAGLYLLVNPNGSRLWRFDYQLDGKRGTVALGVYQHAGGTRGTMSLAGARLERDRCRELLRQGIRPADAKALEAARVREGAAAVRAKARAERAARKAAAEVKRAERLADHWTVERVGNTWADIHCRGRAARTVQQLHQSLVDHVYPYIGSRGIASVTSADIVDVIDRLAVAGKHETANKVRRRLAGIWHYAVLQGYAPADVVMPTYRETTKRIAAAKKVNPPRNLPHVRPAEAPGLMRAIRGYQGSPVTRAALLVMAYTFVRTGELRFSRWEEFDLEGVAPTWTVPAARMKVKQRGDRPAEDHVVPLSRQVVEVLRELKALRLDDERVFPHSRKLGAFMSENTMLYALDDLGYKGRQTGHGFRHLAMTILREAGFPGDVVHAQLAHEKSDEQQERAYNKAEYLPQRRIMLQAYADILDGSQAGKVVPLVRTV
ncbi:DUF4102 domain-containing protein [Zeimonas arvi]|uniref:DUF4102 domain-containing protein n=1 Tax=Zeimonas arvi TaxID=2498847 RepID=A0A5C8P202_9BURK|nr:DUF4102 domain-containing protein [Zeimonas arvi]